MMKMRRVIEIKFRAAGGPAHGIDSCPGANRFLGFSEKPETVYVSSCGLSIIAIYIYKLSARVTGMVIDLEQMERK